MTLLLAPMEGLLDCTLRDVLTRVGGIDRCVSEFIRVTGTLLPERALLRVVPELQNGGCTAAGVPVRPQLLGSDPACLAENAQRLAELGAPGIDLNFGCPAKVVNRHGGGAALLREPQRLEAIVAAVRRAVPPALPVSAKMRLGYDDDAQAEDCARAIEAGGASELVVHARTRAQSYRPPAHWARIAELRRVFALPIVANGEIWTVADALRCREQSGGTALMLGRGMVADPGLALDIVMHDRAHAGEPCPSPVGWHELQPLLRVFWRSVAARVEPRHRGGRLKQWLNLLRRRHPEAEALYAQLRELSDQAVIESRLWSATTGTDHPVPAWRRRSASAPCPTKAAA